MTDPLLAVQELDLTVLRLESRLKALESGEEVHAARSSLDGDESRMGELRMALDTLATAQKRLEYDIDALSQKAAAEEKRLFDGSVANAKELESMQHEIANLKARRGRLEDDLLEQMERREELEARVAEADAIVERGRTSLGKLELGSATELADIAAGLEANASERKRLAAAVDPDLLELYDDLRAQKKGVGAAALVDGICQGCHEKLSAMELDKLRKTDDVKRCDYCRRILIIE